MNRSETTRFLGELLKREKLLKRGKYWASEVTLDYGTNEVKRVDFMQFEPPYQYSVSGLEKGIFICYEVKSCKADFNSGFGVNFIAEKNYLVMPMKTYKEVINEIPYNVGVLCPVHISNDKYSEFENPKELYDDTAYWKLETIRAAHQQERKRSIIELLFCMLRSGKG